jgi:hypothetical protein
MHRQDKSVEAIEKDSTSRNMLLAFAAGDTDARMLKSDSVKRRIQYVLDTEVNTIPSINTANLFKYQGNYLHSDNKIIKLKIINDRIYSMVENESFMALNPVTETTFDHIGYGEPSGKYHFNFDKQGKVTTLKMTHDETIIMATRIKK